MRVTTSQEVTSVNFCLPSDCQPSLLRILIYVHIFSVWLRDLKHQTPIYVDKLVHFLVRFEKRKDDRLKVEVIRNTTLTLANLMYSVKTSPISTVSYILGISL